MKPKLCYVEYVNGTPVAIHDIKEFTTESELKSFVKTCEINKEKLNELSQKEKEIEFQAELKKQNSNLRTILLVAYLIYEQRVDRGEIQPTDYDADIYNRIIKGETNLPKELCEIFSDILGDKK